MNRVSVLPDNFNKTNLSIVPQQKGDFRFCLIWMFIGILLASIPFAAVFTLYLGKYLSKN